MTEAETLDAPETPVEKPKVPVMATYADVYVTSVMLSALMLLKAVVHSDPDKVRAALHCDAARGMLDMSVFMLDAAGLINDPGLLDIIAKYGEVAVKFLHEAHPEWYEGISVALPTDCTGDTPLTPTGEMN